MNLCQYNYHTLLTFSIKYIILNECFVIKQLGAYKIVFICSSTKGGYMGAQKLINHACNHGIKNRGIFGDKRVMN